MQAKTRCVHSRDSTFSNKVVKPHNGPSAVLVLNATGHNVVQDEYGYFGFGLNGVATVYNWFSSGLLEKLFGWSKDHSG